MIFTKKSKNEFWFFNTFLFTNFTNFTNIFFLYQFTNCTISTNFTNNTAKRNGGAVYWNGHNGTIQHSRFENNRATGENKEYKWNINMGTNIVRENNGNLILGDIHVIQGSQLPSTTPTSSDENKLFVLNYTTFSQLLQ